MSTTTMALYAALVSTISLLVSISAFWRERSSIRFRVWFCGEDGSFSFGDTHMRNLGVRL
jgi:hypothetical protein